MGIDLKEMKIGEVNSSPANTIGLLSDSNTSLGKHIDDYEEEPVKEKKVPKKTFVEAMNILK